MEVDGVVTEPSALAHLLEFDALNLNRLEALPNDHMAAVRIGAAAIRWEILPRRIAGGHDANAKSSLSPDEITGLDLIVPDAVSLKFTAAPLTKEQLAGLIKIPPRK